MGMLQQRIISISMLMTRKKEKLLMKPEKEKRHLLMPTRVGHLTKKRLQYTMTKQNPFLILYPVKLWKEVKERSTNRIGKQRKS